MLVGSATVERGGELILSGMVTGDVEVLVGGAATIDGTVCGVLYNRGGAVRLYGTAGDVVSQEGTTHVAPDAVVESRQPRR